MGLQARRSGGRTGSLLLLFAAAILPALAIRLFVLTAARIPTSSMSPTLLPGDRVLVSRLAYSGSSPRRGDVVAFRREGRLVVKRCTAGPGDSIRASDGTRLRLPRAGEVLDLAALPVPAWVSLVRADGGDVSYSPEGLPGVDGRDPGRYTVRQDLLFLTGDNAEQSYDSRFYGPVSCSSVTGRVVFIFWSAEPGNPLAVRWSRIGTLVR